MATKRSTKKKPSPAKKVAKKAATKRQIRTAEPPEWLAELMQTVSLGFEGTNGAVSWRMSAEPDGTDWVAEVFPAPIAAPDGSTVFSEADIHLCTILTSIESSHIYWAETGIEIEGSYDGNPILLKLMRKAPENAQVLDQRTVQTMASGVPTLNRTVLH